MIQEQKLKSILTITEPATMSDLDTQYHGYNHTEKEEDLSEIFEDICQDAEVEDGMELRRNRASRRSSMSGIGDYYCDDTGVDIPTHRRRHSTFNPRDRKSHRDAREEVKEHLISVQDESHVQRRISVNSLMDFNLCLDIAMAASIEDLSPALEISCPVLSYMSVNDDLLDDTIKSKRPSLISVSETNAIANLKGARTTENEYDIPYPKAEYTVELPQSEEFENVFKEKPRKRHSYKVLEQRLSLESPGTVIKGLKMCQKKRSIQLPGSATKSQSSKAQDNCVPDAVQGPCVPQVSDRRQYACGA
jgi:RNA polymerase-binding transcription factor DksA